MISLTKIQDIIARICGLWDYIHKMQQVHDSVCSSLSQEQKTNAELRQHLSEVQANAKNLYTSLTQCQSKVKELESFLSATRDTLEDALHRGEEKAQALQETQNKLQSMTQRYNTMVSKYKTLTKNLNK